MSDTTQVGTPTNIKLLPLTKLYAGENPSRSFPWDEARWKLIVAQLRPAIKDKTIDPIVVGKPNSQGKYPVIAGFQRFEVAKQIGATEIPCCLSGLEAGSVEALDANLSENVHREDLSMAERALAAKRYAEAHNLGKSWGRDKGLAQFFRVSVETSRIWQQMAEGLSRQALAKVHSGELDAHGARLLAGLDEDVQDVLLKAAILEKEEEEKADKTAQKEGTAKAGKRGKKVSKRHVARAAEKVKRTPVTPEQARVNKTVRDSVKLDKARQAEKAKTEGKAATSKSRYSVDGDNLFSFFDVDMGGSPVYGVKKIGTVMCQVMEGKMKSSAAVIEIAKLFSD